MEGPGKGDTVTQYMDAYKGVVPAPDEKFYLVAITITR